jgi:nitroreductase
MTDLPHFDLGAPLPAPEASAEMLARLAIRRSAPAQALLEPGPSEAQLDLILTLGARSPDHGKLTPWRFVVLGRRTRSEIAERLAALAVVKELPAKATAVLAKLTAAPVTILVVSTARPASKPEWEQVLSAGAVCMNIEHAASALGFASSWITDWYSYDAEAAALFGVTEDERVAGFIHIGTAVEPLQERERPDIAALTTRLP